MVLDRRAVAGPDCGAEADTTEDQMAMVEPMEMESTKAEQKTSAEQKTTRDQEAMAEQKSTKDQEELWRMPPSREN